MNNNNITTPVVKTAISGINGIAIRKENASALIMEDAKEFNHREHTPSQWQRFDTPRSAFDNANF
jgi:hypothetical protein